MQLASSEISYAFYTNEGFSTISSDDRLLSLFHIFLVNSIPDLEGLQMKIRFIILSCLFVSDLANFRTGQEIVTG